MIIVIPYILIALVFAFITAGMARRRGRESGIWGVLGFLFGIFAMLLLLVIGSAAPQPAHQIVQATSGSKYDEIAKLKALLDQGVLSQEEFDVQKRRLLS